MDFETSNADLLERTAHYILDRYRSNSNREFFDCNAGHIQRVVILAGNTIDTLKSMYEGISADEFITKINENVGVHVTQGAQPPRQSAQTQTDNRSEASEAANKTAKNKNKTQDHNAEPHVPHHIVPKLIADHFVYTGNLSKYIKRGAVWEVYRDYCT
ncbi:hypothetical protein HK102_012617, partial [Quaeritorhiza haematococci]